jgi:hypothetical protein
MGLQCGIRLLDPQQSYSIGDTLEAELLWQNIGDETINSQFPAKLRNPECCGE